MSEPKCIVGRIFLSPHPTNPELKIGNINGETVVVGDHYINGQLGFFIPEGAIIPDKLAEEMWVKGRLAGKKKNRVKARKIDGVHSNGLFYGSIFKVGIEDGEPAYQLSDSWDVEWFIGDDVTDKVGITFSK